MFLHRRLSCQQLFLWNQIDDNVLIMPWSSCCMIDVVFGGKNTRRIFSKDKFGCAVQFLKIKAIFLFSLQSAHPIHANNLQILTQSSTHSNCSCSQQVDFYIFHTSRLFITRGVSLPELVILQEKATIILVLIFCTGRSYRFFENHALIWRRSVVVI